MRVGAKHSRESTREPATRRANASPLPRTTGSPLPRPTVRRRKRPPGELLGGLGIVGLFGLVALLAPALAPYDPLATDPQNAYVAPGAGHPFGTDRFGMDVFSRVLHGARVDLWIVAAATAMAAGLGIALGAGMGFRAGALDWWAMRLLEMVQAFPTLILAMAVVAALGQDSRNVIAVMAVIGIPYYARLVRAEVMLRRGWPFVEAARALGCGQLRILVRHLLPNCLGSAIAYAAVNAAWALLVAAGLGFLGLGARIPTPEWGLMISMGATNVVTGEWWVAFFPGAAIVLLTTGLYLLADGLRDWLDPRTE